MRALVFLAIGVWLFWSDEAASKDHERPILEAYFLVFDTKSANDLPLSEDATFFGSLLSEPITGRDQVVAFLNRVAPSVELKQVKQAFEGPYGACAELVFFFQAQDVTLEEAHCIKIRDGKILSIRLYYDPRPLMGEPND